MFAKIRTLRKNKEKTYSIELNNDLYQNYLKNESDEINIRENLFNSLNNNNDGEGNLNDPVIQIHEFNEEDQYFKFLDKIIFGSPSNMEPVDMSNFFVKKNNKGLVSKLSTCENSRRPSEEILRHNYQKVLFYEQNPQCDTLEDVFVSTDY